MLEENEDAIFFEASAGIPQVVPCTLGVEYLQSFHSLHQS